MKVSYLFSFHFRPNPAIRESQDEETCRIKRVIQDICYAFKNVSAVNGILSSEKSKTSAQIANAKIPYRDPCTSCYFCARDRGRSVRDKLKFLVLATPTAGKRTDDYI